MKSLKTITLFSLISTAGLAQAPRMVIVEDFTGTWCGYCPRGKTVLEDIEKTYPGKVIGMEVHSGDTYANTYSKAIIAGINPTGFPMGSIDRFAFGGSEPFFDTGKWKPNTTTRLNTTSPVEVGMVTTYNTTTRALSVTVNTKFKAAASGDMRISCVLIEDGVVTPNDPQQNYMNTTVGDPWYGQGSSIPNYVHNGVARVNLATDSWGTTGVIPATVASGASYSKTYTYTLPATMNAAKTYIVAFVSKHGTANTAREIMNANKVIVGNNTVGIEENVNAENQIEVKEATPNPFSNITNIQFQLNSTDKVTIEVYNAFGQLVSTLNNTTLSAGVHNFYWDGTNENQDKVSNGVYRCVIRTAHQQLSKSLVYIGE